ncbi:MAG: hypothetical protein HUU06_13655 [Planctomycetaceae bacterium]|nr:hypothetical protein [Planctomycetota bacterium]NUN53813.1 hypothetical protein [Planctomycetaceae bacterium]
MKTARLALLLLASLLPAVPGCMSDSPDDYTFPASEMPEPEGFVESGTFVCRDFAVLWETAKIQATKNGYYVDDDATSFKGRRVVTTWKLDLATLKNSGKRRRRFVEFREAPGVKDGWKVAVSTVVQRNADMDDPLNPARANWRSDEPDLNDAEKVAFLIEGQFKEFGPSREFEVK